MVQALFLAMAMYPEVQKKAQAEIDSVVGPNRLPNFEDRPSLPYINAVVKETMRWHVPAPLGVFFKLSSWVLWTFLTDSKAVPHMATNDDEYDGYYIPKGTVVLGNAWSVRTIITTFCPDFSCSGPYCTTLNHLATPWNISLNGFWKMDCSNPITWTQTLWFLVLVVGWSRFQHIHDLHLRDCLS